MKNNNNLIKGAASCITEASNTVYQHEVVLVSDYYIVIKDNKGNNLTIPGQFKGIKRGDFISSEEIGGW
jgi:hypothetical protein